MNGYDGYVGRSYALEVAEPEFRIRVDGVFDENAKGLLLIRTERIGYSLNGYRAGRSACAEP
jgi:hypothetical protein